jgi:ribosomal protein L7/L12
MPLSEPDDRFKAIVEKHAQTHAGDLEGALGELRTAGANQIESIKALVYGAGLSLKDGKELLDRSETWSDHRPANESLRDAAEAAVRALGPTDDASRPDATP